MKILITDDSTKWLLYHKSAIEEIFKNEVIIDLAHSAKEGVEKITLSINEPYDIIMTDMQMEPDFCLLYTSPSPRDS